jgi:hypothetical protein
MNGPATKPTGSAVTTDEPVPHCTVTENYMESLEQQVLFYTVMEHKKIHMVTEEKLDVTVGISKKVTGWACIENEHVCVISNKTAKCASI